MTEKQIMAKVKEELEADGVWFWVAHKSPYYPQSDIFGIFDVVYLDHAGNQGFIQATSKSHLSHRRNKIVGAFRTKRVPIPARVQVWAYDSDAKGFIKETIT